MRNVTVADLKTIGGRAAPLASKLVGPINKYAAENGIDTPLLMSHFLAHMAHETTAPGKGGFATMVENLNYTTPGRLMEVWPSRFKTRASENGFLKNPQALANKVYNGRLGNRPGSNDGWDFRGSGPFQLTGRANYREFGKAVGIDLESNPELARDPDTGVEIAAKYFAARMIGYARKDDITGSTKALNGGTKGLADRKVCLARAKKVLGVGARPAPLISEPLPVDEPADAPADTFTVENEIFTDAHRVQLVQNWLKNLGYPEVGTPDGKLGDFTKGAIRDYRANNELPAGDFIDAQLMLALATDTKPREIAAARAEATSTEVREKVPETQTNWLGKIWARITGAGAGALAAIGVAYDNLGEAKTYLDPIKDAVGDVPTWVWFGSIAVGAWYLGQRFRAGEAAGVKAFQEGARR